jgi:hypothetical protein
VVKGCLGACQLLIRKLWGAGVSMFGRCIISFLKPLCALRLVFLIRKLWDVGASMLGDVCRLLSETTVCSGVSMVLVLCALMGWDAPGAGNFFGHTRVVFCNFLYWCIASVIYGNFCGLETGAQCIMFQGMLVLVENGEGASPIQVTRLCAADRIQK